ncbi:hypothetical protein BDQ12DRAFT_41289 [Crucibulum laeve]|uniref:Uncharacterized protein n=1 Tax=Crucibulum laeve TaxID=68775 RepID=A0A5C3MI96_9AGAR|nr:hypothetical protein BDQ12DRAFT_41289 [Crucibulum laeve]
MNFSVRSLADLWAGVVITGHLVGAREGTCCFQGALGALEVPTALGASGALGVSGATRASGTSGDGTSSGGMLGGKASDSGGDAASVVDRHRVGTLESDGGRTRRETRAVEESMQDARRCARTLGERRGEPDFFGEIIRVGVCSTRWAVSSHASLFSFIWAVATLAYLFTMASPEPKGHFAAYRNALKAISTRTGTPLTSLVLSFGVLHEITAILPLIGVFYASRSLGIGERVVSAIVDEEPSSISDPESATGMAKRTLRTWVHEGDKWAAKVGRYYGIFGYEKKARGTSSEEAIEEAIDVPGHIADDVANAIVAYGVTKALLPVRIGASLYLSPMFSRQIIEPFRKLVIRPFRRDS